MNVIFCAIKLLTAKWNPDAEQKPPPNVGVISFFTGQNTEVRAAFK